MYITGPTARAVDRKWRLVRSTDRRPRYWSHLIKLYESLSKSSNFYTPHVFEASARGDTVGIYQRRSVSGN